MNAVIDVFLDAFPSVHAHIKSQTRKRKGSEITPWEHEEDYSSLVNLKGVYHLQQQRKKALMQHAQSSIKKKASPTHSAVQQVAVENHHFPLIACFPEESPRGGHKGFAARWGKKFLPDAGSPRGSRFPVKAARSPKPSYSNSPLLVEGHETRVIPQPQRRYHHLSLDVTELNKDILESSPQDTPQA